MATLSEEIMKSRRLKNTLLFAICLLLFLFVLQAKTAVYDTHAKVTPTTASKLRADGQRWQMPAFISNTTFIWFWTVSLFLLILQRRPEWRVHQIRHAVDPRLSSRQHLQRFLRPPPVR